MEVAKKRNRKNIGESKKTSGSYASMDELSAAKMAPAKDFIAAVDMTLFMRSGAA